MIADAKAVIGAYLRSYPDLSLLVGNRIAAQLPTKFSNAYVLMSEIGNGDRSARTDHLVSHLLQFDVYAANGASQTIEANLIGRTIRAALGALTADDLAGWVPSVLTVNGPRDMGEDTNFEPAKARTVVDAEILLHPTGPGS